MEASIIHTLNQPVCVVTRDVEHIKFSNEAFNSTFKQTVNLTSTGLRFLDIFIPLAHDKETIKKLINSTAFRNPVAEFIQVTTCDAYHSSQETDLSSIYNIHISRVNENEVTLLFIKQVVSLEILQNAFLRSHVNAADMVHQSPLAIHVVNEKGIVIYANKRELDLMEYSANEYIGHSRIEFLPSKCEKNDHYHSSIAHVGRNFEVSDMLFDWVTKSGNVRQMMMSANVRYFSDDEDDESGSDGDSGSDDDNIDKSLKNKSSNKINGNSNKHSISNDRNNNNGSNKMIQRRFFLRSYHRDDTEKVMRDTLMSLKKDLENEATLSAAKDAFIRRIFHEIKTPLHIVAQEIELSYSHLHTIKDQIDTVSGTIEDLSFATCFQAIESKLIQQQVDISSPRNNINSNHTKYARHHSLHHQQQYLPKRTLPTTTSCEMLLASSNDYEYQNLLHMIENIITFVKSTEIRSGQEVAFKIEVPEILRYSSVRVHTGLSRVLFHLIRNGVIYSAENNAQVSVIVSIIPHLSSPSYSSFSERSTISNYSATSFSSCSSSSSSSPPHLHSTATSTTTAKTAPSTHFPVVPVPLMFSASSLSSPLSPSIYANNFPPTPVANTARSALSSARFPVYDTTTTSAAAAEATLSSTSSNFSTLNINTASSHSAAAASINNNSNNHNSSLVLTPNKYSMMPAGFPSTPSSTTAGGALNGTGMGNEIINLNFKVCNTCETPLDREDVEKCFHTYFTHEKKTTAQSSVPPSQQSSPQRSSESSTNITTTKNKKNGINNSNKSTATAPVINNNATTTTSTLLENSLTSIQGKRLGLYVAYNKLKIMQSHLECIAQPTESIFTFNLYNLDMMNEIVTAQSAKFVTVANIGRILSKSRSRSAKSIKISFKDNDNEDDDEEEEDAEGSCINNNNNQYSSRNGKINNESGLNLSDLDKGSPNSLRSSSNSSPNKNKLYYNTTNYANTNTNSSSINAATNASSKDGFLASSKGNHMPSSKSNYYNSATPSFKALNNNCNNALRTIQNNNNRTSTATTLFNTISVDSAEKDDSNNNNSNSNNNTISLSNDTTGSTTVEEEDFLSGYSNHGVPVRVLIVDDSVPIIKAMSRLLKAKGFVVGEAHNGKYACDILSVTPCPYDVVLMDLRMPVMDGITATKYCREVLNLHSLPIIAITAEVGHMIQDEVMKAGANACLTKPVKTSIIIETIFNLVSIQG